MENMRQISLKTIKIKMRNLNVIKRFVNVIVRTLNHFYTKTDQVMYLSLQDNIF